MQIGLIGGSTDLSINNASINFIDQLISGTYTGNQYITSGITFSSTNDVNLSIKNVHLHSNIQLTGTGGASVSLTPISLFSGTNQGNFGQQQEETFSATSNYTPLNYFSNDANKADLSNAISTTALTATASLSTEKRCTWLYACGAYSIYNNCVGPSLDCGVFMKSTPGTTISGYKHGIILKRHTNDATTYLDCYVNDNGTSTFLYIDKVVSGTITNLATSSASGTRISTGTPFWIMGLTSKNTVTVTYFSNVPANSLSSSNILTTLSYTLSSTDINNFGEKALGWSGFSWIPISSNASITNITRDSFGSVTGEGINDCTFSATPITNHQYYGIFTADTTNLAKWWRFKTGTLKFNNLDFSKQSAGTAQEMTSSIASAFIGGMNRKDWGWITTPTSASISPGASPYIYINSDGYTEDVAVYSGIVSNISISRDNGSTFGQVAATTGSTYRLQPLDQIQVTYSVTPTMEKVPVLVS